MKLPIPPLGHTWETFKKDASVYESYDCKQIDDFFQSIAPQLQSLLYVYDKNQSSSYLHRLWSDDYLRTRDPLSIASNFSLKIPFKCELGHFLNLMTQICLDFRLGKLKFKNARGNALFPLQFDILKGACRIPQTQIDTYRISELSPDFISISYGGELFRARILDEEKILMIDFREILQTLPQKKCSFFDLSQMSSEQAAQTRNRYKSFNSFFDVIENSLFHVCLINEEFDDLNQKDFYMHYQVPIYAFKPLTLIYNIANGEMYFNAEHMFEDGGTIAWILENIFKNLDKEFENQEFGEITKIEQYFDEDFENEIQIIKKDYLNQISKVCNKRLFFKANHCSSLLSKDFIAQASIVYASKKAFDKFVSQYEAVDMREYDFGRTECLRAIGVEMKEALDHFCKESFLKANEAHKQKIKNCKKAMGYDRHLLGLKNLIPALGQKDQQEAKKFFESRQFIDVSQTIISTSSLGKNDFVDTFFFHPVHQDGFGISYANVGDEFFYLCTYFAKDCEKFQVFQDALGEFFAKLESLKFD